MKHYLLSIQQPDGGPPSAEFLEPIMRDVGAFNKELEAAGAWVFGGGLHEPSTATVVRLQDGEVLTTDGPYVEGKEHVGGLSVIKAPDLDSALEVMLAAKRSAAQGRVIDVGSTFPDLDYGSVADAGVDGRAQHDPRSS